MANSRHGGSEVPDLRSADLSRRRFLQQGTTALAALALNPGSLLAAPTSPTVTVSTPTGSLRGESVNGIRIFRGVPFAQPPVGPLRFRPTLPVKPWQGVRDALHFGPAAMQPYEPSLTQSEDCLYLNLWAPPGPGPCPGFVWIHGGGFTGGHAFAPIFDGTIFAREGIVLVTVAYRLGVFGFMDLGPLLGSSYDGSGNNALRDMVSSLEWVHNNIAAFGGDPNRVTIGGESAGAKATAALMALPQSRNLFQSAISESGGGERVLTPDEAVEVAHNYGTLWRSLHPSSAASFDDLRTASATSLIAAEARLIATSVRHFRFRSEIDEGFLPNRPTDLIAAASSKGKRLLIGTNRDESALFLGPHPTSDPTSKDLGNVNLARFKEVFAKYKTVYPDMPDDLLRIRAVTAEEYWVPSIRLADAHTRTGGTTWMYRLDYAKSTGRQAGRSFHSLDLPLVWQWSDGTAVEDPVAQRLSRQMHQAWVAFIRNNTPAAPGLPDWPAYNPDTRATMILAPKSHVEEKPFDAELQLWSGVL